MLTKSLIAALSLAIAAPAFADNAGLDQMSRLAGVQPGVYSAAQLVQLEQARKDNDAERVAFILSQAGAETSTRSFSSPTTIEGVTPGRAQLAALIGVNAADYTLAQLIQMQPQLSGNN